jgi:hypothetical protein
MKDKFPETFDDRWNGKSIAQRHWHFHRQLLARYGLILWPGEFSEMLRDIKSGRALLIKPRSKGKGIYSVRLRRQFERIYVLSNGIDIFTAWPADPRLNEIRRRVSEPEIVLRLRPVKGEDSQ